ncbi:hypothetical protein BJX99DRAFT_233080 [Aspergillus californicus]
MSVLSIFDSSSGFLLPTIRTISLLLGVGMVSSGITSALNPIPYSGKFGFPIRDPLHRKATIESQGRLEKSGSGWVAVFAGRELTIGSTLLVLNYLGEVKALSILVSSLYFTAAGDVFGNIWYGLPGSYKPHFYMTIFALWAGPVGLLIGSKA